MKKEEAPKSFADLLDPKWKGKIVKAHPGYSGTIMTATFQTARDIGWDYFEKLAQQNVLQVQSASVPPKKLALGERAVQADGVEYLIFKEKRIRPAGRAGLCHRRHAADRRTERVVQGRAPTRTPRGCSRVTASRPSARQLNINVGGLRSAHLMAKDKPGRMALKDIKLMKDDAEGVLKRRRGDQGSITLRFSMCDARRVRDA